MADLYINVNYEEWKRIEKQFKAWEETEHGAGTEYYHKALRVKVNDDLSIEFHAPVVKARMLLDAVES